MSNYTKEQYELIGEAVNDADFYLVMLFDLLNDFYNAYIGSADKRELKYALELSPSLIESYFNTFLILLGKAQAEIEVFCDPTERAISCELRDAAEKQMLINRCGRRDTPKKE